MIRKFISLNMGIGVTGSITSWLQRQRDCAKTLCYNTEKEDAIDGYVCKIRGNSFYCTLRKYKFLAGRQFDVARNFRNKV